MATDYFREELVNTLSEEIASGLDRGAPLDSVDAALSVSSPALAEDEIASLRLFASCYAIAGRLSDELPRGDI